jgi:hypothetical protein
MSSPPFNLATAFPSVGENQMADGKQLSGVRLDRLGAQVNADSVGLYYEAGFRGRAFFACNTGSQALSLNSTTCTGLALTNPAGSGRNLILIQLNVSLLTVPAGTSNLILTGSTTAVPTAHGTPLTVNPTIFGKTGGAVGLADSACTMPTLTILRPVGGGPVAGSSINTPQIQDNINGQIVLGPSSCISLQTLTTAISVIASLSWIEVPAT